MVEPKNKVVLDVDYVDYSDDNLNDLLQVGQSNIDYRPKILSKWKISNPNLSVDYKRTVSDEFNWMFGVKYSDVNTDNELRYLTRNSQGLFEQNPDQSNRFIDEVILASYLKFTANADTWMFSGI